MPTAVPARSEIPGRYTWDTASVFPSAQAWEAAVAHIKQRLPHLQGYQGRLAQGAAVLADWFQDSEELEQELSKVDLYAECAYAVDTTDQAAAAMASRAGALSAQAAGALAFADPELLEIGVDTLRQWVAQEPRLAIYAHAIDELAKQAAHLRSAEVEQLLGEVSDSFRSASLTHSVLADADLRFAPAYSIANEPAQISQGNIDALIVSPDRAVRRTAWESYADAHLTLKNTMANCLATCVKEHVFEARARRYGSCLQAALEPNHIPVEVYRNVTGSLQRNYPTWHRYWRVLRRALGYDQLYAYDIKAPLSKASPEIPFQQCVDWICDGMAPLGQEYVDTMRRGVLEQRWVDLLPNQGKSSGAFSTGVPGTHPFVLMSYTDDIYSQSTLAHELGHSLHSYSAWRAQPYVYADYGIFVAEVASNFNQAMVRDHLLKLGRGPQFEIALIEEAMSNFHRYFFLMPTLARFELEIHEREERGEGLTADGMIELMADLFAEGFGEELSLDRERIGITWAQFHTHLYANFYVYQYTTGISGAHALLDPVFAQEPGAVEDYLGFLRAGSSKYPMDALQEAGVDLTAPEPIQKAFDAMSGLVDRLAELQGVSAE